MRDLLKPAPKPGIPAKIWLIPTANLAGTTIVVWDVASMLFEGEGIALN